MLVNLSDICTSLRVLVYIMWSGFIENATLYEKLLWVSSIRQPTYESSTFINVQLHPQTTRDQKLYWNRRKCITFIRAWQRPWLGQSSVWANTSSTRPRCGTKLNSGVSPDTHDRSLKRDRQKIPSYLPELLRSVLARDSLQDFGATGMLVHEFGHVVHTVVDDDVHAGVGGLVAGHIGRREGLVGHVFFYWTFLRVLQGERLVLEFVLY